MTTGKIGQFLEGVSMQQVARKIVLGCLFVGVILLLQFCTAKPAAQTPTSRLFDRPQRVTLRGYDDHAMEPFLTRDGRYLLFNNLNEPAANTNLHFAERIDDLTFRYRGEVKGVNTAALDAVATMDRRGTLYFVSTRDYEKTYSTIFRGSFVDGQVTRVELVPGVSRRERGMINFDVDISPDGETLYFVDARFGRSGPETADIVIAERRGAGFERRRDSAEIMKLVNTGDLEFAPCISADGLTLLFTRARIGLAGGSLAIFVTQRKSIGEPFGPPMRLEALEGYVEAPTFSVDERAIYYHKKEDGKFRIYRASK
jgi:Tol biopolymer transport system component